MHIEAFNHSVFSFFFVIHMSYFDQYSQHQHSTKYSTTHTSAIIDEFSLVIYGQRIEAPPVWLRSANRIFRMRNSVLFAQIRQTIRSSIDRQYPIQLSFWSKTVWWCRLNRMTLYCMRAKLDLRFSTTTIFIQLLLQHYLWMDRESSKVSSRGGDCPMSTTNHCYHRWWLSE